VTLRYLLDTNIVSDLMRNPRGRVFDRIAEVGEASICTSLIVAAELRSGATKKNSSRLTARLETVLGALEIINLEAPVDKLYAIIRSDLERMGQPMGGNDMLIAAHALAMDLTLVTDNEAEFARISQLRIENWIR
jgi:tRNA(fMet)-specific endonuclease VapC